MLRVLMVCAGNICRSPTAEAVLRAQVAEIGLTDAIDVDSAGTGAWHAGESPDARSTAAAAARGIALLGRARQVTAGDFYAFDVVLAVDGATLAWLEEMTPPDGEALLALLDTVDVPDPYHGGPHGFEDVLDQVTTACARWLARLRVSIPARVDGESGSAAHP